MSSDSLPTSVALQFLTAEESARRLATRYWQQNSDGKFNESVAAIAKDYGLPPSNLASVVASYCVAFLADESCHTCGETKPIKSRAELEERRRNRRWYRTQLRQCSTCLASERQLAQQKVDAATVAQMSRLQKDVDRIRSSYPYQTADLLSFECAVYLVSLFRAGGSDDFSFIAPQSAYSTSLSPAGSLDLTILRQLYRDEVIAIHPGSKADAVMLEPDGENFRFYPLNVHWLLPIPSEGPSPAKYLETLEKLLRSRDRWPDTWLDAAPEMHRNIAHAECMEYLRVSLQAHGFHGEPSERTSLVIRSVLAAFSIGQAYNFIWRAARDAAAFLVREASSKAHAANIIPGAIQRAAERAIAERWAVKAFRRDRAIPESHVSHVLFTLALQLPDGGFGSVPPPPPNTEPTT